MNKKLKWGTAGRLRRGAVVLGVVSLAAGAAVMTAGSALAANGSQPGNLTLNPASGATTLQPTWSTSTACPTGNQGSAVIEQFNTDGTANSRISVVVAAPAAPIVNATLLGTMSGLLGTSNIVVANGGTVEWAVECYSGPGGTTATGGNAPVFVQSTFVTEAAGGATFTTSATGPVVHTTTTTLTAAPNPAAVGATVTLTATEVANDATHPAGSVQFMAGATNIGTPVAVNASGVATTTTTFTTATPSQALSAVFTPTDTVNYSGSTGTFTLAVGSTLAGGNNPVAINVTVPSTGALSVTVATGSVTLTPASPATTPDDTATGTLNTVTISDTRNTTPGWSVAGQESVFTGPGTPAATIPANSLGWTPAFVGSAVGGAVIGAAVAPSGANTGSTGPGLGTAATLALAHAGTGIGTNNVNAGLLLDIPSTTPPGAYAGTMTITFVSAQA